MSELIVLEHDFNPDRLPWEKQKGESAKAFGGFALYRDLGFSRSITTAAQLWHEAASRTGTVASVRSQFGAWSAKWRWVERCELYDRALDARHRQIQLDDRDRLLEEIGNAGEALRMVGLVRLLGHQEEKRQIVQPLNPHDMDAADVARFLELGMKMGLRALGEPTDFVKGAFLIAPATVTKMVGLVADVALRYIDEGMHERFLREAAEATGGNLGE